MRNFSLLLTVCWCFESCLTSQLDGILAIKAGEYLESKDETCHILSFSNDKFTTSQPDNWVNILMPFKNESNDEQEFQKMIQQSKNCLIKVVEWKHESKSYINYINEISHRVIRSALLVINCNEDCERAISLSLDKPTFFLKNTSIEGKMVLRVSCPPLRAPKTISFWNGTHSSLIKGRACPFVFHGMTVNVSYTPWPPSAIGY